MARAGWDAIVVGAGPAGSAVAARLARAGRAVLLLDRDGFPRAKACGECLSPAAVAALDSLGALRAVLEEPHAPLAGWRIHPPGASAFTGGFAAGLRGVGVRRERLDARLLEHARACGAEVRTGARVVDVLREGGRVVGVRLAGGAGESLRGRVVVGADGLRSVVVRRLGLLRRPPRLRKLALTAHVRGLPEGDARGELHVYPWGCVGVAAVGEGESNVTVVVADGEATRVAGGRERYFDDVVAGLDALRGARRIGEVLATGPFDWPTRAAVADGALLVGDAAGYYDPFTGQGIYRALRGAELAAATVDDALRAGCVTAAALAPYERARRRAFAPGLGVQRIIEAFVSRPWMLRAVARRFRRRPELADALIAVTADVAPARSLARPRVILGLAGL